MKKYEFHFKLPEIADIDDSEYPRYFDVVITAENYRVAENYAGFIANGKYEWELENIMK